MDTEKIFNIIHSIFSESGYKISDYGVHIKCSKNTTFNIIQNTDWLSVKFSGNRPIIDVSKFIRLSFDLVAIHFSKTGGVLEINNFPDIPFDFEDFG